MYQFNRSITSSNSIIDKKYEPPYTQSLNIQNNFKTRKIFPRSNIPLYKKYSLFSQKTINTNIPSLSHSISKTVSNKSHMDYHNNSNNNRIITEYGKKPNNLKNKYRGIPIRINTNKKIEKDLEMMKLQMSCDLITHKINQIKDKVQNLHEASIEDDKNLINKNMGINVYQKKKSNYIDIYSNKDFNINNNYKRYVFMDFSKLRNKKFLKISNEMSKEINNTFDNSELNRINDNFRTFQNSEFDLDLSTKVYNNKIIKLSYKNNLKHLLLNTQSNEKEILNDNINNIYNIDDNNKLDILNDINKMNLMNKKLSYKNKVKYLLLNKENNKTQNNNDINNNYSKLRDNTNNNEIESYTDKGIKLLNNLIYSTEENHENYYNNNSNEINNNNAYYNKNIKAGNKIKENSKEKIKENNNNIIIQKNKNNNLNNLNKKFGFLDNYFVNDNLLQNSKNKNMEKHNPNNKINKAYKYKKLKINKNLKKIHIKTYIKNNENNNVKLKENVENAIDGENKLLLYSNLEKSNQNNLNLNKNKRISLNKKDYIKITNNAPISYANLIDEKLRRAITNNNKNYNTINNSIPQNNNDIIKDNKFKININNISNYSIKNNCLNINNSSNKNKNENKNQNKNDDYYSNKKDNIKLNHNYSKDDLIITSEKMNFENESNNVDLDDKVNNDIIKMNMNKIFEKDEIVLDPIIEEEIKNKNKVKPIKKKHILLRPYKFDNIKKRNDKKIRKKHKELCHKFTDNPQLFFTVKLNEFMLKTMNLKNKQKQKKS